MNQLQYSLGNEIRLNSCYLCVCVFQKIIAGKSYYLAKEIVSTERTYLKDLEVITVVSGK